MQDIRKRSYLPQHLIAQRHDLFKQTVDPLADLRAELGANTLCIDRQRKQLLARNVMKLARDTPTLVILELEQPPGQIPQGVLGNLLLRDLDQSADIALAVPAASAILDGAHPEPAPSPVMRAQSQG